MPLVFVHGVSNRDTPEYRDNEVARDACLRQYVAPRLEMDGQKMAILNPYWGEHGVTFRWHQASLPEAFDAMETFGAGLEPEALRIATDIVAPLAPVTDDIVAIARYSLTNAIDVVWGSALSAAESEDQAMVLAQSSQAAFDYTVAHPAPDWLLTVSHDNFVDVLLYHIERHAAMQAAPTVQDTVKWESFGGMPLRDELSEGLSRFTALAPATMSAITLRLGRKKAHLGAALFLGDIFEYLTKRGDRSDPGPIVTTVLNALRSAHEQAQADASKLIIIAHSLGGVITYDILTHFAPTLAVDVFITVGSQVALFEEMGLYKHPLPSINAPAERLHRPANIKRWINVLDPNDVFSFRAEGVYIGVTDFKYDTGYGLKQAHSGYFHRPSFYRRLGERLAEGAS